MKNVVLIIIALLLFYPPQVSTSQKENVKDNTPIEQLKKENCKLNKELAEAVLTPSKERATKIIYKTKTVHKKPNSIILYIRAVDGTISEHIVSSQDGFYIVEEADLMTKKDTVIDFVNTPNPIDIKKTWWKRKKQNNE